MAFSLKAALALPWSALMVLSGDKSFIDNPVLGSPRLNALGLHGWRTRTAHRLTAARREALAQGLAGTLDPALRAAFDRDGFVAVHDLLPASDFERLRDAVLAHAAPAREMLQGDTITRRIAVDRGYLAGVPALSALLNDPRWQSLTRYAAGFNQPPWVYLQTILARSRDAPPDPQTHLHADTFHPTMKAWYFLTDVAHADGPLRYVPGSHRLTPQRLAWERKMSLEAAAGNDRYSARGSFRIAEDQLAALGLPPPHTFAVPANTLIVADTFGFHARGESAHRSKRIEVWGYDRRNPFMPWTTDAALRIAGQLDRRAHWYWQAMDARERIFGRRNPWQDAGAITPDASS